MNAIPPAQNKFADAIEAVARTFCGAVNKSMSTATQLRFGTRGSLSVEIGGPKKGTWCDHDGGGRGGTLDLLRDRGHMEKPAALEWLKDQGFLEDRASEASRRARVVASYDYRDEKGTLLYQVLRWDPKNFTQRRPGGNGWIASTKNVRRVLYRLPELIAADPTEIVFLPEGEKDVENLRACGLIATCNAGGAAKPGDKKWLSDFANFLSDRDVAILVDNDETGEHHAQTVASSLLAAERPPSSVRIVRLPGMSEKGADASDWLAAGGTVEQLRDLVAEAPDFARLNLSGKIDHRRDSEIKDTDLDDVPPNEDGLAIAFATIHEEDLRFCHHAQHWFTWSGSVWTMNETSLGFTLAREVCRRAALSHEAGRGRATLAKAATAAAVERMAKADRVLAVEQSSWNQNTWLLGTPEGTVDLNTGALRQADRNDLITKKTAVAPAPRGTLHPLWSKFLRDATNGDDELVAFLQRLVGYCLTGDVTEETLAFLYGDGGTGKGTFIGTIVSILGDYAVSVPIETFTANTKLNLEYYRAQMAGARLVTASETEGGATWAESQIKEMTGNETPLSGRHPYGKAFTYRPTFKIVLIGNHAPRLKARSKAMERRLRIVPFKHAPAKADYSLKERLRAEYPAILRWAIDGCVAWQRGRLKSCEAVDAESGAYFEQQDHVGRWFEDRCDFASEFHSTPSSLLADYLSWAKENNEAALTSSEFRETLERRPGLQYIKRRGVRIVRGVQIRPDRDQMARERARYGERDDEDYR